MKKYFPVVKKLISACLWSSIIAQDFAPVGTSVAQFLEVGNGARYIGMGHTGIAIADGISSLSWNPAGLAKTGNFSIYMNQNQWPADITFSYVAAGTKIGRLGSLAFHILSLQTDAMEITTLEEPDGTGNTFDLVNHSMGITFSRYLTDQVAFGITIKNVKEGYLDYTYSTIAADIGTQYHTNYRDFRIGLAIQNFGPDVRFSGGYIDYSDDESYTDALNGEKEFETYSLPMNFKIGTSINIYSKRPSSVILATDMIHSNNNLEDYNLGMEYSYKNQYFLRTGYKTQADISGITFGFGTKFKLKNKILAVHYSYSDLKSLRGNQQISMEFRKN